MPDDFYNGTNWEQSSGPIVNVEVHEQDVWPVDDNAAGAKDVLAAGLHPVVAVGERTAAGGRPGNVTGVVVTYTAGTTTSLGIVELNIAEGMIVRQYVANIRDYSAVDYETAPSVGMPVYVDDSATLSAGVTLSMAEEQAAGLLNPQAGVLWYCQDEMANSEMGGARAVHTFDNTLADTLVEQEYCVLLTPLGHFS
jgi:hypothetical protein